MSYLPTELLKRIFWFQEEWWLTHKRKLIHIQKLSQISRIVCNSSYSSKCFVLELNFSVGKKYILGYKELYFNTDLYYYNAKLLSKTNQWRQTIVYGVYFENLLCHDTSTMMSISENHAVWTNEFHSFSEFLSKNSF